MIELAIEMGADKGRVERDQKDVKELLLNIAKVSKQHGWFRFLTALATILGYSRNSESKWYTSNYTH